MRERRGRVVETRPLTAQVTLIIIDATEPAEVSTRAGQFVSIQIPGGGRRSYSVVSPSGQGARFEIAVKLAASDGGTAQWLEALQVGSDVSFFGPMGYFLFDESVTTSVLLGATGVGITALMPMIDEALKSGASIVELFWGLRDPADQLFSERLEALATNPRFRYHVLYSGQGDGHITAPLVTRASELNDARLYLCGHGQMIADVIAALAPSARNRVHTEAFYPVISTA